MDTGKRSALQGSKNQVAAPEYRANFSSLPKVRAMLLRVNNLICKRMSQNEATFKKTETRRPNLTYRQV